MRALALLSGLLALAGEARADPGPFRLGVVASHELGEHAGELYGRRRDYTRDTIALEGVLQALPGKSRFGTPYGAELVHRVGLRGREPGYVDTSRPPRPIFQLEGAFDAAPLHGESWRIVTGFGAGLDLDTGRWFPAGGRLYPLILVRAEIFPSRFGLHLGWTWIPTTSNDAHVREHLGELWTSFEHLSLGTRLAYRMVEDDITYRSRELSLFAGWIF